MSTHLPEDGQIDVPSLSKIFDDTTNSYKFYWFLSILDSIQKTDAVCLPMQELSLRMVAAVWYPLDYYKLSFGAQDQFGEVARFISTHLIVNTKTNAPDLISQLRSQLTEGELAGIYRRVKELLRWVPFRFIRPFFQLETRGMPDHQVNNAIIALSNQSAKAPYRLNGDSIVINEAWMRYFQRHQFILRGFINWHLVQYLQKNNPNVPAISEKLKRPVDRDFKTANPFWRTYLQHHPDLTCIYSGQPITTDNISLDHYLPFSFVAHDQLWNLIPTTKNVNSAKNDWLPDKQLYFDKYARLQYDAFQFYAEKGESRKLEDYLILFRASKETIRAEDFVSFRNRLQQAVNPQVETALNMGFSYPFIYRPA